VRSLGLSHSQSLFLLSRDLDLIFVPFSFCGPNPTNNTINDTTFRCAYWAVPYPIDTIKSEIQTMTRKASFFEVGKEIVGREGIKGLYRGVSVTMIRAMPGNATIFFVYEKVSKFITSN